MRHNLYDEREKEARKLKKLIDNSPWRKKVVYKKPYWSGDYEIRWVLNPKHETYPDADVAQSLIYLIPKQVIGGYSYRRWNKDGRKNLNSFYLNTPSNFYISENEYFELDFRQQKFFTNHDHYQGYSAKTEYHEYVDYRGRTIYRMKSWEFNYFYMPVIAKHKVRSEWIRVEEPEHRKWMDKLYRTGFGNKYLFHEHYADPWEHYDELKLRCKLRRQLQRQIDQGVEDFYEEKEGTT